MSNLCDTILVERYESHYVVIIIPFWYERDYFFRNKTCANPDEEAISAKYDGNAASRKVDLMLCKKYYCFYNNAKSDIKQSVIISVPDLSFQTSLEIFAHN